MDNSAECKQANPGSQSFSKKSIIYSYFRDIFSVEKEGSAFNFRISSHCSFDQFYGTASMSKHFGVSKEKKKPDVTQLFCMRTEMIYYKKAQRFADWTQGLEMHRCDLRNIDVFQI